MKINKTALRRLVQKILIENKRNPAQVWQEKLSKIKEMTNKLLKSNGITPVQQDIFLDKSSFSSMDLDMTHIASVNFKDIDLELLKNMGYDTSTRMNRRDDGRRQISTKGDKFAKITKELTKMLHYGKEENFGFNSQQDKNQDALFELDDLGYVVLAELIEPEGMLSSDAPDEAYGYRIIAMKWDDLDLSSDEIRMIYVEDELDQNALFRKITGADPAQLPSNAFYLFGEILGC